MSKPPEVKGHVLKRIWQKIKSEKIFETDLLFDPTYVPWVYMDNVIQRSLARMVGQGPYGPVTIKCTEEGNLAVVSRGGAFDDYESLEFAFSSANEAHDFTFAQQVQRVDLFSYDGRVDYQLTRDLVKGLGDKIELFEDSFYSLDVYTRKVRATSKSFNPKSSGTNTTATDDKLIASAATFETDNVSVGDVVANITESVYATVTSVDSETQLTLSDNIFPNSEGTGKSYTVEGTRVKLVGWFAAGD